jgi:steroid 5-alpha reductase family enzyme
MIGAVLTRLGEAWLLCAVLQLGLWAVQQRTRNAGIVDVGWAGSFTAIAVLYGITAVGARASYLPIGIVVVLWSARLSSYLISRGAASGDEEGRYRTLRKAWAPHASSRFFVFFQAQGALAAVLSSAFVVPFVAAPCDAGGLRGAGLAVAIVGLVGETVADGQLARFRRDPANRGRVCEVGLWGYSRHPNYFFEWCVWLGYAVYGLAFGVWGLIAIVGQAIIVGSIFGVTGIPPTEAQAVRSKGDAYREYQRRVSRFVPMPPKSHGRAT